MKCRTKAGYLKKQARRETATRNRRHFKSKHRQPTAPQPVMPATPASLKPTKLSFDWIQALMGLK